LQDNKKLHFFFCNRTISIYILGVSGFTGKDGRDGRDGNDGANGRDGEKNSTYQLEYKYCSVNSMSKYFVNITAFDTVLKIGRDGLPGIPGLTGLRGPKGAPGAPGNVAHVEGGAVYVRWGRKSCGSQSTLLYAGELISTNLLCHRTFICI